MVLMTYHSVDLWLILHMQIRLVLERCLATRIQMNQWEA